MVWRVVISAPRNFLKWIDVVAIFCLAVLPDLVKSCLAVSNTPSNTYPFVQMLVLLTVRSLQVSVPILLIMKLRNVSWSDYGFVGFRKLMDILIAVGLVVLCYCTYYGSAIILYNCGVDFSGDYDGVPAMTADASISLGSILLIFIASAANGFAEELAIRSYLLTRLSEIIGSKAAAVILTSVLFAAYHSYQGRYGVLAAVMAGLVFGTYFAKTNRFWPIFIAHFIMDALPLTLIAASSE